MEVQPELLLAKHTVLRTNSVASLHAYILGMEGGIERRLSGSGPVAIELRRASLGRVEIGVCSCSIAMTVEATREPSADFLVQFPLAGSFDLNVDGCQVAVVPGAAAVISPAQHVRRTAKPGWTLIFSIPGDLLRARLEMRLGHSLAGPLMFQPLITAGAADLLSYGLLVVEGIERGAVTRGGTVAAVLEDGFIDLLLDLQPHSHGTKLVRSEAENRSDRIRLVTDYLAKHFREPLTVQELAQIAGCSVRSLQAAFSDLCGMSPMEYLRRYRLSRARCWLEAGECGTTVSDVAGRAGFVHLARFAASYKARYGESPSETLRRATQGAQQKP